MLKLIFSILSIAKKGYLGVLKEDGEEIPEPEVLKPFSGQTRLRMPKSLHQSLANGAKKEAVSLNTHIVQLLSQRSPLATISEGIKRLEDSIFKTFLALSQPPVMGEASETEFISGEFNQREPDKNEISQ